MNKQMEGPLWFETRDALAGIADAAAKYDTDGVDVHFLNDRRVGKNMKVIRGHSGTRKLALDGERY